MGDVDGPVIEVLAWDPDEESPTPHRRPRVLIVAALLGALVIGAVGGAQLTRAFQRAHAAAPPPTRLSAAALVPAGGQVTTTRSGAGWMTAVDLVLVNAGPSPSVRSWRSGAARTRRRWGARSRSQPIDRLVRGVPQRSASCCTGRARAARPSHRTLQVTLEGLTYPDCP